MEHGFTKTLMVVLEKHFKDKGSDIYVKSDLLKYLNIKTRSANRGSKARGSFGNLYAIYVIVEDYINNGFHKKEDYAKYEGAKFSDLLTRQRELPFGKKLQNHALNHRMNKEFEKYFHENDSIPILREPSTNRYWFNENLLKVKIGKVFYNIAEAVIEIVDEYVRTKKNAFDSFIKLCEEMQKLTEDDIEKAKQFVTDLLKPNVDARLFEIVSYSILKYFYHDQVVYFGFDLDNIEEQRLVLYKTGRTNANDGGIDFVMKPLGRFFQVTETTDVKKYFLDIDKLERYPVSFVIKDETPPDILLKSFREKARNHYSVNAIIEKYMACIEEIINIPIIKERFEGAIAQGYLKVILDEIVIQSKVEFHYEEGNDE